MIRKFRRMLHQSQKGTENLFQMQILSSVESSQCVLYEQLWVENPSASRERSYFVGAYQNEYPDAFIVLFQDNTLNSPKDIIWLRDCFISAQKHHHNHSMVLMSTSTSKSVSFYFRTADSAMTWRQKVRELIIHAQKTRQRPKPRPKSFAGAPTESECNTGYGENFNERFVCLRRSTRQRTTVQDLESMFEGQVSKV